MAIKYFKTKYPGVRYRLHHSRKNGVKPDQYFAIYYYLNSKRIDEGLGWASKEWTAEKANAELSKIKEAHRTGIGPQTMAEAREKADQKRAEQEQARQEAERDAVTFDEYFKDHYLPAQSLKKPDTIRTEKIYHKNWLSPVIGSLPFNKITIIHFQKIRKNMIDSGRAVRSMQYVAAIGRQVWNHARILGYVNSEFPYKNEMKKFKIDNKRMRFLTTEEANTLLEKVKIKSQQLHDICLLSLHCGLRAGEIFSLRWSNIDVDEGIITVLDAKAGSRPAFMTTRVKEMFKHLEPGDANEIIFKKRTTKNDAGEKKIVEISNAFNRAIDDLHLNDGSKDRRERVCFHTLRHSYASHLAQAGTSLYVIQKLMGHKQISLTERYSHLSNESFKAAINVFEKTMNNQKIININSQQSASRGDA
jgi:integrase